MPNRLTDPAFVRRLLKQSGFTFSKRLGQNFLIDPSVCPRMAELCGAGPDTGVLEIGPGVGALTAELAARAGRVAAVELDRRLLPVLARTVGGLRNVRVIQGDILKLDLARLLREEFPDMPVVCCANLPYYITTPVLTALLERRLPLKAVTVMVQKETAERLCAAPGTRAAGAVSYAVSYYAEPSQLFSVGRRSFVPPPNVDSVVIGLRVREKPAVSVPDEKLLFRLIAAAFQMRRKTLLNALSAGLPLPKPEVSEVLARTGIDPAVRGERLTLDDFSRLCAALHARRPEGPPFPAKPKAGRK